MGSLIPYARPFPVLYTLSHPLFFFCSFHFLPIFLLAQILMRADTGDEPERPLKVIVPKSGGNRLAIPPGAVARSGW